jgi:hypothetical protein
MNGSRPISAGIYVVAGADGCRCTLAARGVRGPGARRSRKLASLLTRPDHVLRR